jgi:hypothetical protein
VLAIGETRFAIIRGQNSGDGTSDMLTDEGDLIFDTFGESLNTIADVNIGGHPSGSNAFAGHVHEVIYYNRFLNESELDQLFAYLAAKWTLS